MQFTDRSVQARTEYGPRLRFKVMSYLLYIALFLPTVALVPPVTVIVALVGVAGLAHCVLHRSSKQQLKQCAPGLPSVKELVTLFLMRFSQV